MNKFENILKSPWIKRIVAGLVCVLIAGYIGEYVRVLSNGSSWTHFEFSANPFVAIKFAFTSMGGLISLALMLVLIGVTSVYNKNVGNKVRKNDELKDERGFYRSQSGLYGTAYLLTDEEFKGLLDVKPLKRVDEIRGTIFGINPKTNNVVYMPPEEKGVHRNNHHIAICGAPGSGKSYGYVRANMLQALWNKESIIVTDPKGELYNSMSAIYRHAGYNVKVFNLIDGAHSDSWACLEEIRGDSLLADTFAQIIIQNTVAPGGKSDEFYSNAEMNLLKALILYVIKADKYSHLPHQTIGEAYQLMITKSVEELEALFYDIPDDEPEKQAFKLYASGTAGIQQSVVQGLGTRMQLFQNRTIRNITTYKEIDLAEPGRSPCAYFVVMSDQERTTEFLSSLFFSFLFIKLVKYADTEGVGGRCKVPVNFILDEFPNIGMIPDFVKKLATVRSRAINIAIIFQSFSLLEGRYPRKEWNSILGSCDSLVFLGSNEFETAKYISDITGEMTTEVESTQLKKKSFSPVHTIPEYREGLGYGKRNVFTASEIRTLNQDDLLLFEKGLNVMKLKKFGYPLHPLAKYLKPVDLSRYIPKWRKDMMVNYDAPDDPYKDDVAEAASGNTIDDPLAD